MQKPIITICSNNEYSKLFPKSYCLDELYLGFDKKLEESGLRLLPLPYQKVSCGLFGISDDYIEKYISLDEKLIKDRAATFLFRAQSSSMQPTIWENDILVVDRSLDANHGKVVILSFNGEMYCKRLFIEKNKTIFKSDNISFKPLSPEEDCDVVIFGVVTAVIKENP